MTSKCWVSVLSISTRRCAWRRVLEHCGFRRLEGCCRGLRCGRAHCLFRMLLCCERCVWMLQHSCSALAALSAGLAGVGCSGWTRYGGWRWRCLLLLRVFAPPEQRPDAPQAPALRLVRLAAGLLCRVPLGRAAPRSVTDMTSHWTPLLVSRQTAADRIRIDARKMQAPDRQLIWRRTVNMRSVHR